MNKDCAIKPKAIFQLLKNTSLYFSLAHVFYVGNELNLIPAPSHRLRVHRRNQPQKCQKECKCEEAHSHMSHSCWSRSEAFCILQLKSLTQKAQLSITKQFLLDFSHFCWEAGKIENISQHTQIFKAFDCIYERMRGGYNILIFLKRSFNDFPG